ncbi:MAG TPA: hypothetical protein VNV16_14130 [Methylibium sp.]|nr:hypothetical protein [Methylibium sp.]
MKALPLLPSVALSLAFSLAPAAQAASPPYAVQFAKGASSATLKGAVKGDAFVDYTLRAGAGQTMTVAMTSRRAYFNVLPPGSQDVALYNSSINGNAWSGLLPQAGVYTLRVYLMRSEARRGTVAGYTLTVSIAGAAASHDAKVPGTVFHATGSVPCTMGREALAMCPFGVIRGGPGRAEVRITPPGGLERVLAFSGGQVSAPGASSIKASKPGDEWRIEINDFERYRIPEAVVDGG